MYFDKYKIRDINERVVLESIINHQPISRASLSTVTKLNKASMTNIVNTLITKKLVKEIGFGESQTVGGRRPIMLELNAKAGVSVSIDIGNDYIDGIATDLSGNVLDYFKTESLAVTSSNAVSLIEDVMKKFEKHANATDYGFIGIVLAVHGIVFENNITMSPNYDIMGSSLYEELASKYDFPIYMENEANLAALGHIAYNQTTQNAVLLSIHTGIGAGIIIDRNLYTGYKGGAGEIGHATLIPFGRQCRCGKKGCLEQYCSTKRIIEAFEARYPDQTSDMKTIVGMYYKDTGLKDEIDDIFKHLSSGINSIIASYDPEILYILSRFVDAMPEILDPLQTYLKENYDRDIPIVHSTIEYGATLKGGASMGITEFLGINNYQLNHD